MSILYSKRGKGIIKWIWVVFAVLLILSMIFAFSGSIELFNPNNIAPATTPI
ncbi:MAG: hypothetical protein KBC78_00960 [Candidatus Pacebacteria bacterium]|nr:hypothetical protein [Candidatus Paceibacterota bacterium]